MTTAKLSRIKKIDLRKAWNHEALDFTKWLAEDENLQLLSEEVQIDMHALQTEATVGRYNLDILAEEDNTGHKIIIENQLEPTNHDHLGKVITYASGVDAQTIIWIVKEVREEHIKAIDWLNEHLDEEINLFLIKMELWQIGDSDYAPKFQIISQPNDWARVIKQSVSTDELSAGAIRKQEYWNAFRDYATKRGTKLSLRSPKPRHWYDISIGTRYAYISLTINSRANQLSCQIYISSEQELYDALERNHGSIEKELGYPLVWEPLETKKASRIVIYKDANVVDQDKWQEQHEWLINTAEQFYRVFSKHIKLDYKI